MPKATDLPYLAVSPDGSLGLSIDTDGKAVGYIDGDAVDISKKAARALASRWLSKANQNRLIVQGFLPARASERKRLSRLPITVGASGILVGDRPAGGAVTVFGKQVFSLVGTLNKYWTPWGQFALVAGVARKTGKAAQKYYQENFRGDLRAFADYVSDLIKGAAFGATFGTVVGVTIGAMLLWLVFGGGAATTGAAAAAAGRKALRSIK